MLTSRAGGASVDFPPVGRRVRAAGPKFAGPEFPVRWRRRLRSQQALLT